ncbi:hypothetical protein SLEP1_g59668 [Rubroshorea leprosula]|uniref:Gustatory receptor n=1 Tax=Rubroshorea leprosula TaxID=152421 RepID=A0AAV5IY23_9ROSI|nr:hypothetical protein SLEP1_g17454 [Rubroshorea leprosula]GKV53125.1 hypothetical protein SLEP1_g59668 [Rubroshorea leprosula]
MAVSQTQEQNAEMSHTLLMEQPQQHQEDPNDYQLSKSLSRLETFLGFLGFYQHSIFTFSLSWLLFLLLGVTLPLLIIQLTYCSACQKYEIKSFDLEILASQSLVAAISLLCISHNLRKYRLRKFLFVDKYHGHGAQFRKDYVKKINDFFRLLAVWLVPCFIIKAAREVTRVVYADYDSWWQMVLVLIALLVSWTYSTTIYLSGCALFNLVCNFQVIHFENYGKLLERDLDVSAYIDEHICLTHYLSKISHRFRVYLVLEFLLATATQFVSLLETTRNSGIINFINGGGFAVISVIELVGTILFLHAAAKISHRAQALGSVASRWHALVTCSSMDTSQQGVNDSGETINQMGSLRITYSESDLEIGDFVPVPTANQLASYMSFYQKRQAFVMYVLSNPGGLTVYGWRIDRTLSITIVFIEMSLFLFVLGKTITITTD